MSTGNSFTQRNHAPLCLLGAISGDVAEAYYGGVPAEITLEVKKRAPADLWHVIERFNQKYAITR